MSGQAGAARDLLAMTTSGSFTAEYLAEDRGPHLLAATWFMTSLGLVGVGGRMFIRYRVLKKGSSDDWYMLYGVILLFALACLITQMEQLGGFRHEAGISPGAASEVRKLFWASQPLGLVGSLLPKVSIGVQLLHILPQTYLAQRWGIYISLFMCTAIAVMSLPMVFAQCNPVTALFEAGVNYPDAPSSPQCWDPFVNTVFFASSAGWNALVDLLLTLIPMALIMGLHIKPLKKALLVNFLGARCFACVSGIIRAVYLAKYSMYGTGYSTEHDFTWQAFHILLWQIAEQFCLCFCGSVPAYKALFDRWNQNRSGLHSSEGLAYMTDSRGARFSMVLREKDWFYERGCFNEVEHQIMTSTTASIPDVERGRNWEESVRYNLDRYIKTPDNIYFAPRPH